MKSDWSSCYSHGTSTLLINVAAIFWGGPSLHTAYYIPYTMIKWAFPPLFLHTASDQWEGVGNRLTMAKPKLKLDYIHLGLIPCLSSNPLLLNCSAYASKLNCPSAFYILGVTFNCTTWPPFLSQHMV